jgi:hypothetical protein
MRSGAIIQSLPTAACELSLTADLESALVWFLIRGRDTCCMIFILARARNVAEDNYWLWLWEATYFV